jgi:hypothetical protein
MSLYADDRLAIHELISLHGHLSDDGKPGDLDSFMTEDAVYDLTDFGMGVVQGLSALRRLWESTSVEQPLGHHVTNVTVSEESDGVVRVRSKGLAVMAGGQAGTVVYDDIVQKTAGGWRLVRRKVTAPTRK